MSHITSKEAISEHRDVWARGRDYVYVSLVHAFKMDLVTWTLPFMFLRVDPWSIALYGFCLLIFVVPIFFLQSFLGQFASTSYINVFRIAPLFKGIGYLSLILNYLILTYQSIFASIPLLFLWNSFRRPLPWSCEAPQNWAYMGKKSLTLCTAALTPEPHFINDVDIPSVLYLRSHFEPIINERLSFSWQLFVYIVVVWVMVYSMVIKKVGAFGKLIGSLFISAVILLIVCLYQSLFTATANSALATYFEPTFKHSHWPQVVPVVAVITFGSGWGSTISMASYNQFNANVTRYSFLTCIIRVILMGLFGMFTYLIDTEMRAMHNLMTKGLFDKQMWEIMLAIPSAFAAKEYPQLWSIIFCTTLLLAGLMIIATQLYALITAILDEFPTLRTQRILVTRILITSLIVTSSFFCFDHSETFFSTLATDAVFSQTALNLLLLLIVLWIYGRERFQKDVQFMLKYSFPTWLVYFLRFITPICALFVLYFCYQAMAYQHTISPIGLDIIAILFIALPWLLIPGYMINKLMKSTGSLRERLRNNLKAKNWYPLELEDLRYYADVVGNFDLIQRLRDSRANGTAA